MTTSIYLTKQQAIKKLAQIKVILKILNETFPATKAERSVYYNGKVIEKQPVKIAPYFYAYFGLGLNGTGVFWVVVTDYWLFNSPEYRELMRDIKEAAYQEGYTLHDAYAHPVAMEMDKKHCATIKSMFVEIPQL